MNWHVFCKTYGKEMSIDRKSNDGAAWRTLRAKASGVSAFGLMDGGLSARSGNGLADGYRDCLPALRAGFTPAEHLMPTNYAIPQHQKIITRAA